MDGKNSTRREFIKNSAIVGAGLMFFKPSDILANENKGYIMNKTVLRKGYAAFDESGVLKPWTFERRAVGDDDILIEIKAASICHSDIHQEKGHWGKQQYPQVPGHEIAGVVTQVGKNVTKFKVGDRAGLGCMVNGCTTCEEEQYEADTKFTYGYPEEKEPTGITQGGYSTHIVVRDHFAVHLPSNISFEKAAPLLCAGITTYSPLMKADIKKGSKVAVAGIGGLGHLAVKIAVSKGAEVYAFTTSADKVDDIKKFGAKEVIVVDDTKKLHQYAGQMDYMICTIPYQFDVATYASVVKPYGYFTMVGMPIGFEITLSNIGLAFNRVNFNASLIGGIKETQEMIDYCAKNNVLPEIQMIKAQEITQAWKNVEDKKARYRYVVDTATI
ncbi:NAD(P)-dependent alcohol dehydrogenase [Aliarcobacter butzleri]|uniref:NAD(P)-dependent alcohol dehydrogenase n=1 Tax=Aliarcobacter butzleri TaxID=28197 RepID=A0AAW7Q437_9BACT|nr:NAD(P)-dependent alcohol dehydrogenase [Aliarcobacter butzleri]MCR8710326.1 NAD(P)-dependent alcohol dehydrogenase [Aliarcobacter butzleri]MDN5113816.1 NAD(P)-dependent alcohol dehydrogenase [Aliarcobacter butzleri]